MKQMRNVITLSNMEPNLEEWAREEAKRRGKHFYQVINEALDLLRLAREGRVEEAHGSVGQSPCQVQTEKVVEKRFTLPTQEKLA